MGKFLFIFAVTLLSVPATARVCIVDSPTIVATQAQFATLSERLDALENPFPWLQAWISASGTLAGSSYDYNDGNQNGTWSVTSDQSGETQTIGGMSMCSSTSGTVYTKGSPSASNGQYCWCRMKTPRAGAWVYRIDVSSASNCAGVCAFDCATSAQYVSAFRASVLSLP